MRLSVRILATVFVLLPGCARAIIPVDPDAGEGGIPGDAGNVSRPAPPYDAGERDVLDNDAARRPDAADAATDDGADDVDPGLPRAAYPRLLRPATAARVTSQRPTLRFVTANQGDGTRVEICRDRGCASVVETMDVSRHAARPRGALPRGVYFWRATALLGGAPTGEPSATWEFFVPPRDTGTDTSWGTAPDVNGDGFADVLTSHTDSVGRTTTYRVYAGGPAGVGEQPTQTIPARSTASKAPFAAFADFNGDGYADTVAFDASAGDGNRVVRWLPGGPAGIDPAAGGEFTAPYDAGRFGDRALPVFGADVDSDGYGDLVLAPADRADARSHIEVHRGGPAGLTADVAYHVDARDDAGSDLDFLAPQDADGDGRPDLIVTFARLSVPAESMLPPARNALYTGPGLATFARWLGCARCVSSDGFTARVTPAGDLDGDGYADAIAQRWRTGTRTYDATYQLLPGGPGGLRDDGPAYVFGHAAAIERPLALLAAGDLDGNGTSDLVEVQEDSALTRLAVYQCLSVSACVDRSRSVNTETLEQSDRVVQVFAAGDVNGDGYDELYVRSSRQLFYGSATGLDGSHAARIDPLTP